MFQIGLDRGDADAAAHYGRLLIRMSRLVEAEHYLTAADDGVDAPLIYVRQKLASLASSEEGA